MHFPKFWVLKSEQGISCWGWSDRNMAEAEELALTKSRRVAERIKFGQPTSSNSYDEYGERPLREQVLEGDEAEFVITRNAYGALVINTARVVFVDVDLDPAANHDPTGKKSNRSNSPGLFNAIISLFRTEEAPLTIETLPTPTAEDPFLDKVRRYVAAHPRSGISVYKTAAGYRLLVTHDQFEPGESAVNQIFDYFDCDPRYRKLCLSQKSFRARLTPKPWRCGLMRPEERWPYKQERHFQTWLGKYEAKCQAFATCALVGHYGSDRMSRQIAAVKARHDELTRAQSGLPLA